MHPRSAAVEVRDLVKTYPGDVRALDGVSFTVEPGTVFGLLGPNGAGKSTTVKILTTLSRPDSGTALVAGVDVVREPNRVRRIIGCVGQKSAVDLEATGAENLMLQGQLYGMPGPRPAGVARSCWNASVWPRRRRGSLAPTPAAWPGSWTSPSA
jgi:ABC-2 type transport system ATP-binding protein